MSRIVSKFGGTSVATKENIEQIIRIIQMNQDRRVIVLSAPGKAPDVQTKVTDYLIAINERSLSGKDCSKELAAVKKRYYDIYEPLGVPASTIASVVDQLDTRIEEDRQNPARYRDLIVAAGEEFSANLFAELLNIRGINAIFASPQSVVVDPTSPELLLPMR